MRKKLSLKQKINHLYLWIQFQARLQVHNDFVTKDYSYVSNFLRYFWALAVICVCVNLAKGNRINVDVNAPICLYVIEF